MKLEPPLSNLVNRCQTICVAPCCGIEAYDFSPVHIASYLLMWQGALDPTEVNKIRAQLDSLKAGYGSAGTYPLGITFEEMNQSLTPAQLDLFVDEINENLGVALRLIDESESKRYRTIEATDAGMD